jgi:hypothetical protein
VSRRTPRLERRLNAQDSIHDPRHVEMAVNRPNPVGTLRVDKKMQKAGVYQGDTRTWLWRDPSRSGRIFMENIERQNDSQDARRRPPTGRTNRKPLGPDEIEAAFRNDPSFPPILSLEQAAQLAHLARGTLKRLVSEGYFGSSVRRGKPIAFWRNRFVAEAMELDKARERNRHSRLQKGGMDK